MLVPSAVGLLAAVGDRPAEQFLGGNPREAQRGHDFAAEVVRWAIASAVQVRRVDADRNDRDAKSDCSHTMPTFVDGYSLAQISSHARLPFSE